MVVGHRHYMKLQVDDIAARRFYYILRMPPDVVQWPTNNSWHHYRTISESCVSSRACVGRRVRAFHVHDKCCLHLTSINL